MIFKGTVPTKQSVKTMITTWLLLWNLGKNYDFKLEWAQELGMFINHRLLCSKLAGKIQNRANFSMTKRLWKKLIYGK